MTKYAIYGAGGHAKVVIELLECLGVDNIHLYDEQYERNAFVLNKPLKGNFESLIAKLLDYDAVVVAIGDNTLRLEKYKALSFKGAHFPSLIHPSAVVSKYASLGEGTVVFANAVVNTSATIGKACIINTSSVVEHDCIVGDGSHLCPNSTIAGSVMIGEQVLLGMGSQVKQGLSVINRAIIGAGTTVIRDIKEASTFVGIPARRM